MTLALSLLLVWGMKPDELRSFREFEARVANGDPEAMYRMSAILEKGYDSIPADSAKALRLLQRAAYAGYPAAQNYYGYLFSTGYKVGADSLLRQNPDSMKYWVRRSADAGDPKAAHNIAYMLLHEEQPQDSLIVAYLTRGVEAGLAVSMVELAELYRDGRCVPQDSLEAVSLYERAIEHGSVDAQYRLMDMMRPQWQLYSSQAALKQGIDYFIMGASMLGVELLRQIGPDTPETPQAYALLGEAASRGFGMPYDHNLAIQYFVKSALGGNPSAKFILAETLEIFPDAAKNIEGITNEEKATLLPDVLKEEAASAGIITAEAAHEALLTTTFASEGSGL